MIRVYPPVLDVTLTSSRDSARRQIELATTGLPSGCCVRLSVGDTMPPVFALALRDDLTYQVVSTSARALDAWQRTLRLAHA